MAEERIGRVSVIVDPDFDQAELFKQVRAATKQIPAITLKPKILARDVNAAIREVNKKKLVPLNLPVKIVASEVNRAIREVNTKRLVHITPPIKITARQVNRAIREVNLKRLAAIKTRLEIKNVANNTGELGRLNKEIRSTTSNIRRLSRTIFLGDQTTKGLGSRLLILRYIFIHLRIAAIGAAFGVFVEAIASAVVAVTALSSALAPGLTGGLAVAGVGLSAFGQALGVISLASQGVIQALGNINKAIDPKKFANLTPAAQKFVLALDRLRPLARGIQQSLQEELFSRLLKTIKNLTPLVENFVAPLQQTSRVLGDLAIRASKLVGIMSGRLGKVMSANNIIIGNLGNAAIELAQALIIVLNAAAPLAVVIARFTNTFSRTINEFIQASDSSGRLAHFFDLAGESLTQFARLLGSVSVTLSNVFVAAFPSGSRLLTLLTEASEKLANFTSDPAIKKGITNFFIDALPSIEAFASFVKELGVAFFRLATQPGLLVIITSLKDVIPVLETAIEKITREFAPALIKTLEQFVIFFSEITSNAGFLNIIVTLLGDFLTKVNKIANAQPQLLKIASAFFVIEAALSLIQLRFIILNSLGITSIFSTAARAVFQFSAELSGLTGLLTSAAGGEGIGAFILAGSRMAGIIGLIIAGITALIIGIDQFIKNIQNGVPTFEAAMRAFSYAVLRTVQITLESFQKIVDAIAKIGELGKFAPGASGHFLTAIGEGAKISSKEIDGLNKQIDKLNDITKASEPAKVFGPELTPQIKAQIETQKEQEKAQKDINKVLKESKKQYKELLKTGTFTTDQLNDLTRTSSEVARDNLQQTLDTMREKSDKLSDALDKQRTKVDNLKQALQDLKEIQIEGTQAFDDARFALDQQAKALELQQVELKLTGAASDDPRIQALDDQLEQIRLQAQKTDLTESLQLDPLRRQWEQTINPIKELSFDNAISEFNKLTKEHDTEEGKLKTLQARYDKINTSIQKVQRTISKLSHDTENLTAGISSAVSAPEVIQKPLEAADNSLTASRKKITQNVGQIREGLRKPFRLATQDIINIFHNLPVKAAPEASKAINWFFAIGLTMGRRLIAGLEQGIREYLVEGSSLYKLLNEEIPDFIRANKGPVAEDRQILVPAGVAIMQGLTTGLRRGFEPVKSYLKGVGPSMEEYVPSSMFSKRTAEFMVEVAAGNKPDPAKFFGGLVPDFPPIDFEAGGLIGGNPFKAIEALFGLRRSSGDHDAPGVHAAGSYHYKRAPWGGVQAYDYGDALNPVSRLLQAAAFARMHANLFAEAFYDKFRSYVINGKIIEGQFGGHGDHLHLAFRSALSPALGGELKGKKTPFDNIFKAAAIAFDIPAALIKAVAKAESGFNARAGSGAGALGLMQLLPVTFAAQHVGSNIFNPRQNIFAGAKYLSTQLKKFKSIKLALAAYNAGPGAVLGFGGIPPFIETIRYISKVLEFLKDFGGFRALGGPVNTGNSFIVGERGPELFIPRKNGHVISNKDIREMILLLREIKDTGGLRQQTTHVTTASRDPEVVAELLDIRAKRRRRGYDL